MLSFICVCFGVVLLPSNAFRIQERLQQNKLGCRYEGRRYQEGAVVTTSEPCLQCRCTEGSLQCRLRVCPRLPNPPPPGCRVRPPLRENVCCSELVCGESDEVNMLRHADVEVDQVYGNNGCLYEGVRYAPGSAMLGSRRCEYCYCIAGSRRCIRPKCLLPLPGCIPQYAPHSCCPVAYNCSRTESSTTVASVSGNGCLVGQRIYQEGEMVRDIIWKAACDNCFCAMGAIRCVPLACAPPLQGCSPIVHEGQCCPSTYNCSGSIQVKATQNYASYAFISKDYAKLRKETNFLPIYVAIEGRAQRVNDETEFSTPEINVEESTELFTDSTSTTILETEIMDNKIITETTDYPNPTTINNEQLIASTTVTEQSSTTITEESSTSSNLEMFIDTTTVPDDTTTIDLSTLSDETSSLSLVAETTNATSILLEDRHGNISCQERVAGDKTQNITASSTIILPHIAQSIGKIDEKTSGFKNETTSQIPLVSVRTPSISLSTVLMPEKTLVMNVNVKTNVSVGHIHGVTINPVRTIPPDIEALLNITHRKKEEDYVYDYIQPTLPPSLPNVRIIPFVAADALVKDVSDVKSPATSYPSGVGVSPELRPTDSTFFNLATQVNRFSPPVETEGGFVPREPPYFDPLFRSTALNLEIGTGVTVLPAAITNSHRKNDDLSNDCLLEGREYGHNEMLPSNSICLVCVCYYGEIVCSNKKCPLLKIGCRRINDLTDKCCRKIVCADTDESPTVVLNRVDATAPSQIKPMVSAISPDPFRDVIKTEPAPDLPSLIQDMIPYFAEHGITTLKPTTPMTSAKEPSQQIYSKLNNTSTTFNSTSVTTVIPEAIFSKKKLIKITLKNTTNMNVTSVGNLMPSKLNETTDNSSSSNTEQPKTIPTVTEEKDIFSLDSVLDILLFGSTSKPEVVHSAKFSSSTPTALSSSSSSPDVVIGTTLSSAIQETTTVSSTIMGPRRDTTSSTNFPSKAFENEIPTAVSGLLKLAGCNIYGRMYRVGKIITELSEACRECRCTEAGVQCKQLEC